MISEDVAAGGDRFAARSSSFTSGRGISDPARMAAPPLYITSYDICGQMVCIWRS